MENIRDVIGHGAMNFPVICLGKETKLELLPAEPKGANFGLGFVPLFIHTGTGEPEYPPFYDVREVIGDQFNTACKAKIHKKFSTWKTSMSLGTWEKVDPNYLWPTGLPTMAEEDDEEGKRLQKLKSTQYNCKIDMT